MQLGDVYRWETEQVQGRGKREKIQVFICKDADGQNVFMYVNSVEWFKDCKILLANYQGFLEYDSYIGCNSVARYSDAYLKNLNLKPIGSISRADLQRLRDAIIEAESMVTADMNLVCRALAAAL